MPLSEEAISALLKASNEQIVHSPEWYNQLRQAVNDLINSDFSTLVQILYRMDVPEQKLKDLLQQNPTGDASAIITDLMLERQLQRIKTRNAFASKENNIPPDEKW